MCVVITLVYLFVRSLCLSNLQWGQLFKACPTESLVPLHSHLPSTGTPGENVLRDRFIFLYVGNVQMHKLEHLITWKRADTLWFIFRYFSAQFKAQVLSLFSTFLVVKSHTQSSKQISLSLL